MPGDVKAISYLITESSASNPGTVADPLTNFRTYTDIKDGSKYFHIRFKNSAGWGPISHLRFQIDKVAPTRPSISFLPGEANNLNTSVSFQATDSLSGVAYYEVAVDNTASIKIDSNKVSSSSPFILKSELPGKHLLVVKAYDYAGNYSEATAEFILSGLEPVKIDKINDINQKELLHVSGETYPESFVDITLKDPINNTVSKQSTKSNGLGFFSLVWPDYLPIGHYEISGFATNQQGDRSQSSDPIKFTVKSGWLSLVWSYIMNFLSPLFLILVVLFALVFLSWYLWQRFHNFRKKLKLSLKGTEADVHKAFDSLRESVRKHIIFLEKIKTKRGLTLEEEKIMKQLRNDLDSAEELINKQIEKLEDKL